MQKLAIFACIALLCGGLAWFRTRPDADDAPGVEAPSQGKSAHDPTLLPSSVESVADTALSAASPTATGATPSEPHSDFNGWPLKEKLQALGLAVVRQRDAILGRVLVGVGKEASGIAQLWKADSDSEFLRMLGSEPLETAMVDREGCFHFAKVGAGRWFVSLSLGDGVVRAALRAVVRPEGELTAPVAIVLGTASLHGIVYGVDGLPRPRARVRVTLDSGSLTSPLATAVAETVTDAAGRYDILRLPGGFGHAAVAREGKFEGLTSQIWMPIYLASAERQRLDWGTPQRMATVRGVVMCAGKPIAQSDSLMEAFVNFQLDVPLGSAAPSILSPYDEQGRFERKLAPGTYNVMVAYRAASEHHGYTAPVPGTIEVTEGQEREVTLAMPGARIAGRIQSVGSAHGPIYVHLTWREGDEVHTSRQRALTTFAYCALKPGRYEIWATMAFPRNPQDISDGLLSYRSAVEHVDVADGDAREVTLQLELE